MQCDLRIRALSDKEYKEGLGIQAATLRERVGDAAESQLRATAPKNEYIVEQQAFLAATKSLKLQQVSIPMLTAHLKKNIHVRWFREIHEEYD